MNPDQRDRRCLFCRIVLALLMLPAAALAADPVFPSTLEGVGCFENLKVPEYPAAALEKKIDGFVWATIQVGPKGEILSVKTDVIAVSSDAQALLAPPVEQALRAAKVQPTCFGTTVSIDFRYELPVEAAVTTPGEASYVVTIRAKPANDQAKNETPK